MTSNGIKKNGLYAVYIVIALFVAGRLFGGYLFDNNWSFSHWQHLPVWYPILWLLVFVATLVAAHRYYERLNAIRLTQKNVLLSLGALFVLLIVMQFDSFLYGGGNLRAAQVAQVGRVIFRWFEFGSIVFATGVAGMLKAFGISDNLAGGMAWRLFAYICTAISLLGAARLAGELTTDSLKRIAYFVIISFGSQGLMYFGHIGLEPIVVATSTWFAVLACRIGDRPTLKRVAVLWLLTLLSIVMHFSLVFLVPAAVFISLASLTGQSRRPYLAVLISLVVYAAMVIYIYSRADQSLEFSKYLLFVQGKLPFSDYGLFDARRLGDLVQILFLAAPMALAAKFISLTHRGWFKDNHAAAAAWWMSLGAATTVVILDPVNSIVLDFPRLSAYLTPFSFMIVMVIHGLERNEHRVGKTTLVMAVAVLMLSLSYLPSYIKTARAENYVTEYFDKHEIFYRIGCVALRDAYFYDRNMPKANEWDLILPVKSPDFLNYRGCRDLALRDDKNAALEILYRLVAKQPYWTEPRGLIAEIQTALHRFPRARAQIDTCLMLEPYIVEHHANLYRYYREKFEYRKALATIQKASELAPGNPEILTDLMIMTYRTGDTTRANSLADTLLAGDSTLPYPYWLKGDLAEKRNDPKAAIQHYRRFVMLVHDETEIDEISNKLNDLVLQMKGQMP